MLPAHLAERDRPGGAAQDHGVAVLEERALPAAGQLERVAPAPGELEQAAAVPGSGPRSCRDAYRSPGRTLVPLTVAWASCCGAVQ